MKIFLIIIMLTASSALLAQTSTADVWINEFHYDGRTSYGESDINEFLELAIKNTIVSNATELAKYKVVLYTSGAIDNIGWTNGKGLPYNVSSSWWTEQETVHPLNTFQQCPVAGTSFTLLSKPLSNLQDLPSAIALIYDNTTVIQLLSYEHAFKIAPVSSGGGEAAGMTTELILNALGRPVFETATSRTDHSVSLIGTGTSYNSFTWDDDSTLVMATPCALNTNTVTTQSFSGPLPIRWLGLNARGSKETIYVQWQLALESGVSKYVVEWADINANFSDAGDVPFNGRNNGSYQFNINNVRNGTYKVRIKSVMQTGEIEYSESRIVKLTDRAAQFVSVFPNPVKNGIANLTIIPSVKGAYTIEVVDLNGKRVSSIRTAVLNANTLNKLEVPMQVAPGIYQIKVINQNEQQTIKVVVM